MSEPSDDIVIRVDVTAGSTTGLSYHSEGDRLTFGRDADNDVRIDLPEVSRRHGELRRVKRRWVLVNLSPNETRLDGRRVTNSPRKVGTAASVWVGGHEVMQVTEITAAASHDGNTMPDEPAPAPIRSSKRRKLWIGLCAYLLAMLGLFVFLSTFRDTGPDRGVVVQELSADAIRQEVQQPVAKTQPNELVAREAITEARELYAQPGGRPDRLYRAYAAYRRAMAHTAGLSLPEPLDQRRYDMLEQELADGVVERYQRGYNLFRSRQHAEAAEVLSDLVAFYPDTDSRVFRNTQQLWDQANASLKTKR